MAQSYTFANVRVAQVRVVRGGRGWGLLVTRFHCLRGVQE